MSRVVPPLSTILVSGSPASERTPGLAESPPAESSVERSAWLRKVKPLNRRASLAIHVAFGTQILLGIATVMSDVNVTLAGLHQLVGALLVIAVAWGIHVIGGRNDYRVL